MLGGGCWVRGAEHPPAAPAGLGVISLRCPGTTSRLQHQAVPAAPACDLSFRLGLWDCQSQELAPWRVNPDETHGQVAGRRQEGNECAVHQPQAAPVPATWSHPGLGIQPWETKNILER